MGRLIMVILVLGSGLIGLQYIGAAFDWWTTEDFRAETEFVFSWFGFVWCVLLAIGWQSVRWISSSEERQAAAVADARRVDEAAAEQERREAEARRAAEAAAASAAEHERRVQAAMDDLRREGL